MAKPKRLRVIAGTAKGVPLKIPAGSDVRPTPDRVREALFSIIGPRLAGAAFLDLYAGSGANGIEALSRGARLAVFADAAPGAIDSVTGNLEHARLQSRARVLRVELPGGLKRVIEPGGFGVIFADPPYSADAYEGIFGAVERLELLDPGGCLVFEHERTVSLEGLGTRSTAWVRTKVYGTTALSFFERENL